MAPAELRSVLDVWLRSLLGSLAGMRPDQLRSEAEYEQFFLRVVIPRSDLWIATLEGHVAGVLALHGSELDRLYVAPEAQNRGLGSALVQHAQRLHPTGLRLVTHQRNTGARRLYERHGFEARRYGSSPPPESEPDVEYAWPGVR